MASPLAEWAAELEIHLPDPPVTLGEGGTPLLRARWLEREWGLRELWLKAEHLNPTGSYKDRFAAFAINGMVARGQRKCLATSSGNTGSALAAYAARAGIEVVLAITEVTPAGKLSQMAAHGARLLRVKGFGQDAEQTAAIWNRLTELADEGGLPLLISAFRYCPEAMRGVSSLAWEIVARLGEAPDACFVPVGGGGLLSAVAMGLADRGAVTRVEAVQPATNDTIASALRQGLDDAVPATGPCRISGLAVPTDIDGTRALRHVRATGGTGYAVAEERIWRVQADLYRHEGIGVEPAGATAVAGVRQALDEGRLDRDQRVVCILTGHGFKDSAREREVADDHAVREVSIETLHAAVFGV